MWTPTGLASEAVPHSGQIWRAVEFQFATATRRLVDSHEDQQILEDILEAVKPPVPPEAAHLHYLLAAPFRHSAPYPNGSRFRPAGISKGVFYASETVRTALAELCFWRMRFFRDAPEAELPHRHERLTVFSVRYKTERLIDLTRPPFDNDRAVWTHPTDYGPTQRLALAARDGGVEAIRYESVRDPKGGFNLALLTPRAFRDPQPREYQTWFLYLSKEEASCERAHEPDGECLVFKW